MNSAIDGGSSSDAASDSSVAFDRAAEYYDATRGLPEGVAEQAVDLLCRAGELGRSSRVLELGIGTGRIALPLAARVERVVGIDLARPMLARLRQKSGANNVDVLLGDALALPFWNASFDAVVTVHVFHLIPAWRQALDEVARVLIPGGVLVNAEEPWLLRDLWNRAYEGVRKPANAGVAHEDWSFPEQAGFEGCSALPPLRYPTRIDMARFLRDIEQRVWSAMWRLSTEDHARLSANMKAAILERFGRLDAVIDVERTFVAHAYRAPSRRDR